MLLTKEINNYVLLALAMLVQFWAGWRFYNGIWDGCASVQTGDFE
jgi:cation transport ATPase